MPSLSGSHSLRRGLLGLIDSADEGILILKNFGNYAMQSHSITFVEELKVSCERLLNYEFFNINEKTVE